MQLRPSFLQLYVHTVVYLKYVYKKDVCNYNPTISPPPYNKALWIVMLFYCSLLNEHSHNSYLNDYIFRILNAKSNENQSFQLNLNIEEHN